MLWFLLSFPAGIITGVVSIALYQPCRNWLAQRSASRRARRVTAIRMKLVMAEEMRRYPSVAVGLMALPLVALIVLAALEATTTLLGIAIQLRYPAGAYSAPTGTRVVAATSDIASVIEVAAVIVVAAYVYRLYRMMVTPTSFRDQAENQLRKLSGIADEPAGEPEQAEPGPAGQAPVAKAKPAN